MSREDYVMTSTSSSMIKDWELDAASFYLCLGPETERRQQPATITQAFATPSAPVALMAEP